MLGLWLVEQLTQPLGALAGGRLVGRDPHRPQPGGVVQRLQNERQRDGRAVRIRDYPVVLECPLAVHLGHDQRHTVLQAEGLGLVDADRAAPDRVGDELAARIGADGEEAKVEACERLGRGLFHTKPADLAAGRAARGEEV